MASPNREAARLRKRLEQLVKKAPPLAEVLRGSVRARYVRCGKAGCHCEAGQGHGPVYYVSVSLGVGASKQVTLTRTAYQQAVRYARNYERLKEIVEEISSINRDLLRIPSQKQKRREGGSG